MPGSGIGPKPTLFVEVGQRFGRLVVTVDEVRIRITPDKPKGWRAAVCRCDCGTETTVPISKLIYGSTVTCGNACDYSPGKASARTPEGRARASALMSRITPEQEARRVAGTTKHGFTSRKPAGVHPLYRIWTGMLHRCEDPGAPNYARYGGRGITICPQWHDLATFIAEIEAEIGPRPGEYVPGRTRRVHRYSLDRIDNNGNYEPGNIRWATAKEQQANRERTRRPQAA